MNQEWVSIVAIENQGVWVESQQKSACDSCNARAGCGQRTLSNLGSSISLWVPVSAKDLPLMQVGQQILLELPKGGLAASALILYGLPLLGLMLFAILGRDFSEGETIVLALVGLGVGFLGSRFASQRWQHLWQPRLHVQSQCIPYVQLESRS